MSTGSGLRNNRVQSLDRALEILDLLAAGRELGVTELSRRLEVHKSTAFRLCATLLERGLVEQNPLTEKYRLGYGLVRLAGAVKAELDLSRAARPVLQGLAERSGETVNLAVLQGDEVINIDQITAPHLVVTVNWIGKQTPLHCTSNGKVLLAFLPEARRERILAAPLRRFTPRTITDRRTLERQLKRVEEEGFAFTLEELELGLNAVAAPVRSADLRVSAAVSLSGPSYRVSPQRLPELGEMVREAGQSISRRLGYAEPAPAQSEEERKRG
jgi:IclR family transcriptional regulator, acetate operon repressor